MYTLLIADLTRDCDAMKKSLSRFCDQTQVALNENIPDSRNKPAISMIPTEAYDLLRALNIARGWLGAYDIMLCKVQRLQQKMYTLLIEDFTRDCNAMKKSLARFCDKTQVALNENTPDSRNKPAISMMPTEEYDLLRALDIARGWLGACDIMLCKLQSAQRDYMYPKH